MDRLNLAASAVYDHAGEIFVEVDFFHKGFKSHVHAVAPVVA